VKDLIYEFKDGEKEKVLEAFEWLASMNSHGRIRDGRW
jgi:hypothetical protein